MRQNDDGKTVAAMDILFPGIGEIVGGSQREERLDLLTKRMEEMSIPTRGNVVVSGYPKIRSHTTCRIWTWVLKDLYCL
jgi:aspartyl/asparaginyl-tRNA synthetase